MPRATWPLVQGRPAIEIVLKNASDGLKVTRALLADTGAGSASAPLDAILDENDCLQCGGSASSLVSLGGAYSGSYTLYLIRVEIPLLNFAGRIRAVGVPSTPEGLDGIACYRFLNRFTYGNFGNSRAFSLEI